MARRNEKSPGRRERSSWQENKLAALTRRREGMGLSLKIHGFVYVACSGLLVFLNAVTTAFPWSYFPIAGWAIGLGAHALAYLKSRRDRDSVASASGLSYEAINGLSYYQRMRGAWNQHLSAFLLTNAYLVGINLISSPRFPWSAIPAMAWMVGLVAHGIHNSAKRASLARRLIDLGVDGALLGRVGLIALPQKPSHPEAERAKAIAARALAAYKRNSPPGFRLAELEPLLDSAVAQVAEIEDRRAQFDAQSTRRQMDDLESDIDELKTRQEATQDPRLRDEYQRAIDQYGGHLNALAEMSRRREVLDLRLASALRLVQQAELDGLRMMEMGGSEDLAALSMLKAKLAENQGLLDDFRQGLESLNPQAGPEASPLGDDGAST